MTPETSKTGHYGTTYKKQQWFKQKQGRKLLVCHAQHIITRQPVHSVLYVQLHVETGWRGAYFKIVRMGGKTWLQTPAFPYDAMTTGRPTCKTVHSLHYSLFFLYHLFWGAGSKTVHKSRTNFTPHWPGVTLQTAPDLYLKSRVELEFKCMRPKKNEWSQLPVCVLSTQTW